MSIRTCQVIKFSCSYRYSLQQCSRWHQSWFGWIYPTTKLRQLNARNSCRLSSASEYLQILKSYHSWLSWRYRRLQGWDSLWGAAVQVHPENTKEVKIWEINIYNGLNEETKSQSTQVFNTQKTKSWSSQSIISEEDMIRDFTFKMSWCCSTKTDDIKNLIHGPIQCLYKHKI